MRLAACRTALLVAAGITLLTPAGCASDTAPAGNPRQAKAAIRLFPHYLQHYAEAQENAEHAFGQLALLTPTSWSAQLLLAEAAQAAGDRPLAIAACAEFLRLTARRLATRAGAALQVRTCGGVVVSARAGAS
jgi:hypothetical protein